MSKNQLIARILSRGNIGNVGIAMVAAAVKEVQNG